MPKYRKKPVVVEAMQWDGSIQSAHAIIRWVHAGLPPETQVIIDGITDWPGALNVRTLEGVVLAFPGRWIIKGVKGEFSVTKPDIFAQTYEAVEEESNPPVAPSCMDINGPSGTKVVYAYPRAGFDYCNDVARKYLVLGQTYTVERTEPACFVTNVYLQEVPGVIFNSTLFAPAEKETPHA